MELMLLTGINWNLTSSIFFTLLVALVAVYSWVVPQGDKRWWGLALLMTVFVVAALQPVSELVRMLLLDAASFAAVALVGGQSPIAAKAAKTYLWMLVAAVLCVGTGLYLAGILGGATTTQIGALQTRLVVGLLAVGFALKLALIPFYFWLPDVAETTSPMTSALIVGVLGIAEFSELAGLRLAIPWVFDGYKVLWLTLALASMFGGALLALAQRDLKRMLAFSTIDDMGYLLLGVLVGSKLGLTGAMFGALSHALFKVLLFGSLGIAEKGSGRPVTLDCRGLASRFPVSGAAFIVGALGMIGVPPFFGFVGRWRLYLAGIEFGGPTLVLGMAAATGLSIFYYVRAIHRVWLGQPQEHTSASASEPGIAAILLVLLITAALLLGLIPGFIFGQA
jgi:formate hydrogenlyase subunit 3/multisubunit Na+/H+ antiporter MnhD subunit